MLSPWQTSRLFIVTLLFHLVSACGEDPAPTNTLYPPTPPPSPFAQPQSNGSFCTAHSECRSGDCAMFPNVGQLCSGPCVLDSDCESADYSLKCGIGEGGEKRCLLPCGEQGVACDNGVPVLCSEAKPEFCADCGCPEGLVCWDGVGCKPPAALGETCRKNSDCETDNCSVFAHVCRVAVGEPCTGSNCDLCVTTSSGSYCSRECDSTGRCGGEFFCTSSAPDALQYCRPPCSGATDASCEGTCTAVAGETNSYSCECPNCATSTPPREFGQGCDQSEQCVSGDCLTGRTRTNFGAGFCTKECASSTECGAGWSCVDIPCIVSDFNCGSKCAKVCDPNQVGVCEAGACRLRQLAEGGSAPTCGP